MADRQLKAKPELRTYKTYLSLYPDAWAKLDAEATRLGVNGRQAIQALLTQWAAHQPASPTPPKVIEKAFPEPDGSWADEDPGPL